MKLLDLVRTANRNLSRSKLRTFLTISAIFVGAFTLTLTTALGAGAQQYLDRQFGNISAPGIFYVSPKTQSSPFSSGVKEYDANKTATASSELTATMTNSDVDKLKGLSGVESARPFYTISGTYITRGGTAKKYVATTISQYTGFSLDLSAGRLLRNSDQHSVILPEDYVSPLGFSSSQDAIGTKLTIAYMDLKHKTIERSVTVVGVMKKSFITQGNIYIDDAFVSEIAKAQGQDVRFPAVVVKFSDGNPNSETSQKNIITNAGLYDAVSLKEKVQTITTIISAVTTGLNVVGVIALFAASFGIINTLLMSVYERTQEVGLMKAMGMHRLKVFTLFAVEAVLVGFWGSLIAVGAGFGVSRVVDNWATNSFLKDFEGFNLLVVTPLNALIVIGLIMLIAFVAGTFPAIKASRLNPIEALRSE